MIHGIIFSKDRACQLDALIRSIDRYCAGIFKLTVLYKYSNSSFEDAYNKLINNRYKTNIGIDFVKEFNYFQDTMDILLANRASKCTTFFTDDSLICKTIHLNDDYLYDILTNNNCYTFSLRCGLNTKQQCHWEKIYQQDIEILKLIDNDIIMWDFTKHRYDTDYGRPISIDGNTHITKKIIEVLHDQNWKCPRTLDGASIDKLKPFMMSFKESVLVNIPVNLVVGGYANNWGKYYTFSENELNDRFLNNQIIDLESIVNTPIYSSHQEFQLNFVER